MFKIHSIRIALIFSFLIISGCTNENPKIKSEKLKKLENLQVYKTNTGPRYNINLEKVNSYIDSSEILFGPLIRDVQVDDKGRVYISDYVKKKVHVFMPDGEYIESIGGKGRGPGEFQQITDIQVDNKNIHVLDPLQSKITVFDNETLKRQKEYNISSKQIKDYYKPNDFYLLSDGNYMIIFSNNGVGSDKTLSDRTYEMSIFNSSKNNYERHNILSFDWTGGVLVYKEKQEIKSIMFQVPYKRSSQFDYENGKLVYGWTEDFLLKFYNEHGDYQSAFYYPFEKKKLTEEKAIALYNGEQAKDAIRNDTLPETWPAFNTVKIDDEDRIWLSRFTEKTKELEWLVFDDSGEWLAKFKWPRKYNLMDIKNGFAYVVHRGAKGIPKVTRFKITYDPNN